jgi:hypothetical protein
MTRLALFAAALAVVAGETLAGDPAGGGIRARAAPVSYKQL